jgi:hypothetical protein
MRRFFYLPVIGLLLLANCKSNEVAPEEKVVDPANAKEVAKVLVMPDGTSTNSGTPPPPTSSAQAPKVTVTQATVSTQNGKNENLDLRFQNVTGGIRSVYVQVDGADTYFTVPVNNPNVNGSGSVQVPVGLPEVLGGGAFAVSYCIVDYQSRVSNIINTRFNVTRVAPANTNVAAGNGTFTVGGKTITGTALCDIQNTNPAYNFYLDADVITSSSGTSESVVLYNIRATSTLRDVLNSGDLFKDPWLGYVSSTGTVYFSESGTATKSGNKVTFSATVKEPSTNQVQQVLSWL